MKQSIVPTYSRAPSPEFQKHLFDAGFLTPLIGLSREQKETKEGQPIPLDVHFRSNDVLQVYYGLTSLVNAQLKKNGVVALSAHGTYAKQDCAKNFLGNWHVSNLEFADSLSQYIREVCVSDSHTNKEGKIQADWSRIGKHANPRWIPFDREAVLSYDNIEQSKLGRTFTEVERARSLLETIAIFRPGRRQEKWARPGGPGRELDQLAIDDNGNLVLIEIKDAKGTPSEVYYAPLQLLQYIHEWRHAFGWLSVSRQLQELVDVRVRLGLMCEPPPLTGGIRAAVCFGKDDPSPEVTRRFYEVLGVVNAHLPSNVLPVEVWKLGENGPQSL